MLTEGLQNGEEFVIYLGHSASKVTRVYGAVEIRLLFFGAHCSRHLRYRGRGNKKLVKKINAGILLLLLFFSIPSVVKIPRV